MYYTDKFSKRLFDMLLELPRVTFSLHLYLACILALINVSFRHNLQGIFLDAYYVTDKTKSRNEAYLNLVTLFL